MIGTLAVYGAGILAACTIAVTVVIVRAGKDETTRAPRDQRQAFTREDWDAEDAAHMMRRTATQPSAVIPMPARPQPSYREQAIREYAAWGTRACELFVHAHDEQANGWGEEES